LYVSECALYDIIKKRAGICPNALYILLLWCETILVWMRFKRFYWNESFYVSKCALYDIIKMRTCMCLNALYMILLKWEMVFERPLYGITMMGDCICLNVL